PRYHDRDDRRAGRRHSAIGLFPGGRGETGRCQPRRSRAPCGRYLQRVRACLGFRILALGPNHVALPAHGARDRQQLRHRRADAASGAHPPPTGTAGVARPRCRARGWRSLARRARPARRADGMMLPLAIVDVGRRPYGEVLELQRALARQRLAGERNDDVLLLVEHDPVVALGRGTRAASVPVAPAELRRRGVDVFEVERGGDVTWHGPGQLVGYPILDLTGHRQDLHWYLRQLEAALIAALAR